MRRMIVLTVGAFALALATVLPQAPADAETASNMRGYAMSQTQPAPHYKLDLSKEKHERSFKQQPPMVPHKVAKYKVDLRGNGCLKCHDKKTYKKEEAPMAGKSHYAVPGGKEQDKIIMSRYFCSQCHAPMTNAKPLVENTFQGAK